jgi:hypothetical protein
VGAADEPSGEVRDDEADEADGAGHRHDGADEEARQDEEEDPQAVRGDTEGEGGVVAGGQGVHPRAMTSRTAVTARTVTTTAATGPDQDARPREPSSQNITEREDSVESEAKIMKLVTADRA